MNLTIDDKECWPKDDFNSKLKFYTTPKPLAKKGKIPFPLKILKGFSSTNYPQIKDSI